MRPIVLDYLNTINKVLKPRHQSLEILDELITTQSATNNDDYRVVSLNRLLITRVPIRFKQRVRIDIHF
jgi:hypothetical protein